MTNQQEPNLFETEVLSSKPELLLVLENKYSNTKVNSIDQDYFKVFFEEFKSNLLILKKTQLKLQHLTVSFMGEVLFELSSTNAPEHNSYCVLRDLVNFYQGENEKTFVLREIKNLISLK